MTGGNDIFIDQTDINITLTYLAFISIIGSIGNAIIIYVYKRKKDELTSTFFILVLAAADLIVCLLVIPYTFILELLQFHISIDFFCKFYYVLNTSNTTFSSCVIVAVALDRYLCICHPLHRILTVGRAKILVASLVVFSLLIGIATCLMVQVQQIVVTQNVTDINGTNSLVVDGNRYICQELTNIKNTSKPHMIFFKIIQNVNHATFIVCIVSVVVCYSLVFRVVLQVRQKNKTLTFQAQPSSRQPLSTNDGPGGEVGIGKDSGATTQVVYQPAPAEDGDSSPSPIVIEQRKTRNGSKQGRKSLVQLRKVSFRGIRESELFQNFRSAGMLFVVAFVYILVFCPSILIAGGYISFNVIAFYLYYVNNMSNPLIYCFMNRGFRQELKRVFFRNHCVQKRFNSYSDPGTTPW